MPNYSDPTLTVSSAKTASAIKPSRVSVGQILVMVGGLLSLAVAGYMFFQISSVTKQVADVTSKDTTVQRQIDTLQPVIQQLTSYNAVGTGLKTLFGSQILWADTYANVESHLYRHMAVTNLQIDSKGAVTLTGTVPSYTDYAKLYSSLNDPSVAAYFSLVKPITVAKQANGTINFTFGFSLAPSQIVYASTR